MIFSLICEGFPIWHNFYSFNIYTYKHIYLRIDGYKKRMPLTIDASSKSCSAATTRKIDLV